MAEGIMKKCIEEKRVEGVTVSSMGTHAQEGNGATDYAVEVCSEHGIDISHHHSRPLIPIILKQSWLIFTMEPVHIDFIDLFFPQVADRVYMLAAWPGRKHKKATVADPVGRSLQVYRKTFRILENTIEKLLPEIVVLQR